MELKTFLVTVSLLITCCEGSESIMHSSPRVVTVCPGEDLTLTCTSDHSAILRWSIVSPEGNITESRLVPFTGSSTLPPINIEEIGVTFNFIRISAASSLPLISELLIDGVAVGMNGTEIHCSQLNDSNSNITFIVHIRGANSVLHPLEVNKTGHHFEATNFTVTLNWTQEDSVSYNISIDPVTELVHLMNNTWQVIGNYNTVYNVSIVATLCDKYNKTTNITLEYATCELLTKESLGITDPVLRINNAGSNNPAIKGDSVTFYCLSGELMGQNTTRCLKNGKVLIMPECESPVNKNKVVYEYNSTTEGSKLIFYCEDNPDELYIAQCYGNETWIPNIALLTCGDHDQSTVNEADCSPPPPAQNGHIVPYNSTLKGAKVTYVCWNVHHEVNSSQCVEIYTTAICNTKGKWEPESDDMCSIFSERSFEALSHDGKIAVASSVSIFTVTSILFYIIGFLSGHFCRKEGKRDETVPPPSQEIQTPYYDDVVLKQHKEQQLELKDNVAYVSHTVTS